MIFAIVRVVCSYKWGLLGVGCCCWRWGTLTRQQPQKRTKHFIHHRISFPSIFSFQIIHQGFWEWINDWIFQEDFFGVIYDGFAWKWWRHKICKLISFLSVMFGFFRKCSICIIKLVSSCKQQQWYHGIIIIIIGSGYCHGLPDRYLIVKNSYPWG